MSKICANFMLIYAKFMFSLLIALSCLLQGKIECKCCYWHRKLEDWRRASLLTFCTPGMFVYVVHSSFLLYVCYVPNVAKRSM